MNQISSGDPFFEDTQHTPKKSFDLVLWFYRILKYWYLFIISLALCLGYAHFKNKKWVPQYQTTSSIVLEARGTSGVAMSVNLGALVRNTVNQQMILKSLDLTSNTIDRLPQLKVDYYTKDKFKVNSLYGTTPITIECQYLAPSAYKHEFLIAPIDSAKCKISYSATDTEDAFSMNVPYGEYVQDPRFYIKINKTNRFTSNGQFTPFNFRFVTKSELVGRYAGHISTNLGTENSSVLTLTLTGTNATQDCEFLDALIAQYQDYNLALKNEAADRQIKFYDKQLLLLQDSLKVSEDLLKNFQQETGYFQIGTTGVDQKVIDDNVKVVLDLKIKENQLNLAAQEINSAIKENRVLDDPKTLNYSDEKLSKFVALYNKKLEHLQTLNKNYPYYKTEQDEVLDMQIQVLEALKSAQAQMATLIEDAKQQQNSLKGKVDVLPEQQRQYASFQGRYDLNAGYVRYLQSKRREAEITKASNVPDNYVLEEPRLSGVINAGETTKTYSFFFLVGLALPLIFIFCKEELFNYAINTKEECERISGLPVIGTIENISKKISSSGGALVKNFPKSSFAESFRNMRIRIEYMAQRESSITVLVTSAEPGDGKTFIAANIASIYQLTGKKVLLVDFDLRRPSVSKLLKLQVKEGVSNYLIGQVKLEDIVSTHPEYGFDVIPAGTLPPNPSELIKTLKTKELLTHLQSQYDYVIVDCSPIGLVSDALVLSRYVDTTLFVVRRAKTNRAFFKSVVNQMVDDGLQHSAIIFNDVKGREGYYGTSRYYGDKTYYLKRNSYYHDDYFEK